MSSSSSSSPSATDPKGVTVILLIVYLILFQPAIYILFKHGRSGILGWLSIQMFCLIRVIGSGVTLHEEATNSTSKWALLVNSIGLSPLLLGTMGVLHEAHSARLPIRSKRLELFLIFQYHILVSVALSLLVIGTISLKDGNLTHTTKNLAKLGLIILLFCWILLTSTTLFYYRSSHADKNVSAYNEGTKLLWGATAVLPFVGVRMLYAVSIMMHTLNGISNGFTRSEGAKVMLSENPEWIVIVVLVFVGIVTRDIVRVKREFEGKMGGCGTRYEELATLRGTGSV